MLKMIHTADLHLGAKWGKHRRWEDNRRVLREIVDYVEAEQIDLMVFAGDILDDRCDPEPEVVLTEFIELLAPSLRRGAGTILVPGNHDRREMFNLVGVVLRRVAGADKLPLLVCTRPDVYAMPGFPQLQVIALPYLTRSQLREPEPFGAPVLEGAELNQALSGLIESGLQVLGSRVDPQRPSIFVGHVLINGIVANAREFGYQDDVNLLPQALPHYTQYNALGHIHEAQAIEGAAAPSWYSGSPDRQDRGEKDNLPRFLRVDLTLQAGEKCQPEPVYLTSATHFVDALLAGPERVHAFAAEPQSPQTLGRVSIVCDPLDFDGLRKEVLAVCPRLIVERVPMPGTEPGELPEGATGFDPNQIIRDVLARRYQGQDLTERLAALDELMEGIQYGN